MVSTLTVSHTTVRYRTSDFCRKHPFQSTYRPKHSTEAALVRIHEDLMQAVDSLRGVLLVRLDLSTAFDTLDHSTLLRRLRAIGLSQTVLAWFMSYLVGRKNSTKIRDVTSAPVIIQHGVPQGSVLGPLLFTIYLLPIADIFDRHQIRYHIYADDTQLYAECPPSNHADAQRKIDECVSDIRQWLDDNHLFLNEAKTEAILFRSSVVHSPSTLPSVYVCGSSISLSPTVRDIGILLDSRLDMSAPVSSICRAAYSSLFHIAKIQNTNESHNCSMQDPRPLSHHLTAELRERCPVRHIRPPLAPP